MASAISRAVASSSARGTTRDTIPWCSASSADRRRPVSTMSLTSPCPHISYSTPTPPVSGITPWVDLRQHEPRVVGRDADVAQQRPLERAAQRPALDGDDDRRLDLPDLLDASVPRGHQLVMGALVVQHADRADVAPRRPRLALASPDDGAHLGRSRSSARMSQSCASISSSNALCFSGLSLVIVAIGPSTSNLIFCGIGPPPRNIRCASEPVPVPDAVRLVQGRDADGDRRRRDREPAVLRHRARALAGRARAARMPGRLLRAPRCPPRCRWAGRGHVRALPVPRLDVGRVEGATSRSPTPTGPNRKAQLRTYPVQRARRRGAGLVPPDPARRRCGSRWRSRSTTTPTYGDYQIFDYTVRTCLQELGENGFDHAHFQFVHSHPKVGNTEKVEFVGYDRTVLTRQEFPSSKGPVDARIDVFGRGPGFAVTRYRGLDQRQPRRVQHADRRRRRRSSRSSSRCATRTPTGTRPASPRRSSSR